MISRDPQSPPPPGTHPTLFRFSLRKMLTYVGLLCVLFAAMSAAGGMFAIALAIFALVGTAHVLGTFVGTRLRAMATETARREGRDRPLPPVRMADRPRPRPGDAGSPKRVAARQLRGRGPVMRRWVWSVAAGSVAAAVGFGGAMWALLWPKVGLAAIFAGAVAAAILGGWLAFLGFSFYSITRRAWREAVDGTVSRPAPPQEIAPVNTAPDPG